MRGIKSPKQRKRNRLPGIVISFNDNTGIGIVKCADGRNIRVSYRDIKKQGMLFLNEGEKVNLTIKNNKVVNIDRLHTEENG